MQNAVKADAPQEVFLGKIGRPISARGVVVGVLPSPKHATPGSRVYINEKYSHLFKCQKSQVARIVHLKPGTFMRQRHGLNGGQLPGHLPALQFFATEPRPGAGRPGWTLG